MVETRLVNDMNTMWPPPNMFLDFCLPWHYLAILVGGLEHVFSPIAGMMIQSD